MKLATYGVEGEDRIGLVVDGGVVSIARHVPGAPATMIELIARWDAFRDRVSALASTAPDHALKEVRLRAPVPRPGKIMAIGLNYLDHIEETDSERPEFQTWFAKATTAVNGPYDRIALPAVSERLDFEAELVIVIGKRVRGVTREQAKDAIFGYCVGNDVSVRDFQIRVSQWVVGKSFDTHAPFGPWITTADENDARDNAIRCLVNGEVMQSSNTNQLLFDAYAQVAFLSQAMTLEPGDVLYTGTSSGVGHARNPQVFLKAGDRVRVEIDGLGHIENLVEAEPNTGFAS